MGRGALLLGQVILYKTRFWNRLTIYSNIISILLKLVSLYMQEKIIRGVENQSEEIFRSENIIFLFGGGRMSRVKIQKFSYFRNFDSSRIRIILKDKILKFSKFLRNIDLSEIVFYSMIFGLLALFYYTTIDTLVQKITFKKCRGDLLLARDKYLNNCIRHSKHLQWKKINSPANGPKANFILEKQCILDLFVYRIKEFNKEVRPAVNQLRRFLLSQKNVPRKRVDEISQWIKSVLQNLRDLVDMVRVSKDYEDLSALKIRLKKLQELEERIIVLLANLVVYFDK